MAITARPLTQQRQSLSTSATNPLSACRLPAHSRNNSHTHAHSALSGALNATHRITRRKSVTSTAPNVAAVAAALNEAGDMVAPLPISGPRRSNVTKAALARSSVSNSLPSPPGSLPTHRFMMAVKPEGQDSAIDDSNDMSGEDAENGIAKSKVRRASDGQPLAKDGKKSSRPDLRCNKCGKGYKHSSCLTKHLLVPHFLPVPCPLKSLIPVVG